MTTQSEANQPGESAGSNYAENAISPSLRRRLQQCYEHARKLMEQPAYDFEYAHTMLIECVTHDPGNIVYLDAFLENLHRKYKNNKRGSMLRFAGKGGFKKAVARQDWQAVIQQGAEVLKSNPWDSAALRGMAEACAAFGFHETELRYLKNALEMKPRDAEVNRHCARSLARLGQFDQAIVCWQRVDEAKGGDLEAQQSISELQIEKTQVRKGKPTSGERTAAVPRTRGTQAEEKDREPRRTIELTPRQQLEQAIVRNPADLESYFALAELHVEERRLGEAAHVLGKALAASGNDAQVQQRVEDVEMLRMRQQAELAEQRAAKNPTDELQRLAEQLRSDMNRYELDVFDRRAQRFPQDRELKFQLALRLKRAGNFRQALPLLEDAAGLEERRAGAQFELGECLQRMREYAPALEYYLQAAETAQQPGQRPLQLLAWYRAAVLSSGLGNLAAAQEQFEQIMQIDPDYRDVAPRLDKIHQIRHKG